MKRKLLILGIVMLAIVYLAASIPSPENLVFDEKEVYEFDGVDDYIIIKDLSSIGNQLTIAAWIKPDGSQEKWAKIISRRNSDDSDYLYHISYDKEQRLSFIIKSINGTDGNIILRNTSFHNETRWYH